MNTLKKTPTKTARKLPIESASTKKMRAEIQSFCKDWPLVALTFQDSNKYYNIGKRYFQAEELFQIAVVSYLQGYRKDVTFFHPKNESKGGFVEQARKKLMGVTAGTIDLFLRKKGLPPFWLELKRKPNKPTKEQIDFMGAMERHGDFTGVAYDLEGVLDLIESWCG